MATTTRGLLADITSLCKRLADASDATLAEFFSDFRGVHDELADLADEVHLHGQVQA